MSKWITTFLFALMPVLSFGQMINDFDTELDPSYFGVESSDNADPALSNTTLSTVSPGMTVQEPYKLNTVCTTVKAGVDTLKFFIMQIRLVAILVSFRRNLDVSANSWSIRSWSCCWKH